jgi:hypothetical protein
MSRAQSLSSIAGLGLIVFGGALLLTSVFRKSAAGRPHSNARAEIRQAPPGATVAKVEKSSK